MITNDRQYKILQTQINSFEEALREFQENAPHDQHPLLVQAQMDAMQSQLHDLRQLVAEYENLKSGRIVVSEVNNLEELPLTLIRSRIANGLTQTELAEKAGLKMQQIQRYEAERYESASLKTLIKIAQALQIKIHADVQIRSIEATPEIDPKQYPFKEMFRRGWFRNFSGTFNDAMMESANLIRRFFEWAELSHSGLRFNRQLVRSGSIMDEFALQAWYAQVLIKANDQKLPVTFQRESITDAWLRSLAMLSLTPTQLPLVKDYLNASGIRFVIEPHLEGTFLDGAALLLKENCPVIALTLRYDRTDNFWFTLFHEIAHVHKHLNSDITAIFDDLDAKMDGLEQEADSFALNALIPEEIWRKSLVRFNPSSTTVVNQAKTLKISPALVAGRIRRETGKYFLFNDLIGQGEVRKYFIHDYNK